MGVGEHCDRGHLTPELSADSAYPMIKLKDNGSLTGR